MGRAGRVIGGTAARRYERVRGRARGGVGCNRAGPGQAGAGREEARQEPGLIEAQPTDVDDGWSGWDGASSGGRPQMAAAARGGEHAGDPAALLKASRPAGGGAAPPVPSLWLHQLAAWSPWLCASDLLVFLVRLVVWLPGPTLVVWTSDLSALAVPVLSGLARRPSSNSMPSVHRAAASRSRSTPRGGRAHPAGDAGKRCIAGRVKTGRGSRPVRRRRHGPRWPGSRPHSPARKQQICASEMVPGVSWTRRKPRQKLVSRQRKVSPHTHRQGIEEGPAAAEMGCASYETEFLRRLAWRKVAGHR